jgi:hypothetical protein
MRNATPRRSLFAIAPLRILLLFAAMLIPSLITATAIGQSESEKPAGQTDRDDDRARAGRPTARERAAARRAAREAAAKEKRQAERRKWLARLQARGVEAWPEAESDEEHAAALAKSREMIEEVISLLPGTQLYETENFLFASNIPPQQVAPYIASLDRMYGYMCRLYGVPRGQKVWLGGKAPIFAFLEKEQFDAFEERFFPDARRSLGTMANIYGLSHLSKGGEVVISCYRGNDPNDFGQMLVHETSHGFIHRYKTKARLPNWVDEGMADLVGAEMVPASTAVRNRELRAIRRLAAQHSLGGMLSARRIENWQYGLASSLNRFLLRASRDSYVRFIEALKEGMKWEEALAEAYNSTPEEMLAHYGQWIGVPGVRP